VFPLPVVVFPSIELPLQIFDPRYRDMIDDIWHSDGIFGTIRIAEGARTLAVTDCLPKLTSVMPMSDGRINTEVCSLRHSVDRMPKLVHGQ